MTDIAELHAQALDCDRPHRARPAGRSLASRHAVTALLDEKKLVSTT